MVAVLPLPPSPPHTARTCRTSGWRRSVPSIAFKKLCTILGAFDGFGFEMIVWMKEWTDCRDGERATPPAVAHTSFTPSERGSKNSASQSLYPGNRFESREYSAGGYHALQHPIAHPSATSGVSCCFGNRTPGEPIDSLAALNPSARNPPSFSTKERTAVLPLQFNNLLLRDL